MARTKRVHERRGLVTAEEGDRKKRMAAWKGRRGEWEGGRERTQKRKYVKVA